MAQDSTTSSVNANRPNLPGVAARRLAMWAVLVLIVGLIALSIIGAQVGDRKCARVFNSPALAGVWVVLLVGLLAGPLLFRSQRRFASLAMHYGAAFVLVGGLWGSQAMHDLRAQHGGPRLRDGHIQLVEGVAGNRVTPIDRLRDRMPKAEDDLPLPFSLRLDNFWLDLYEPAPDPWWLYVPVQTGERSYQYWPQRWQAGEAIGLGRDIGAIAPFHYLPGARTFTPWVNIDLSAGRAATQPATQPTTTPAARQVFQVGPGESETLPNGVTVTVLDTFSNYHRREGHAPTDLPGPAGDPAAMVRIDRPGRDPEFRLIFARTPHPVTDLGMSYVTSVVAAGAESSQPGMWVAIDDGAGGSRFLPIIPTGRAEDHVLHTWPAYPLGGPFGESGKQASLAIALIRYRPGMMDDIRSFNSDVTVLEEGSPIGRQVIRVNQPMHYGGYHVYQSDYEPLRNDYTVLRIVSDAGLGWVYAGFFVMIVGVFWRFWFEPVIGRTGCRMQGINQAGGP